MVETSNKLKKYIPILHFQTNINIKDSLKLILKYHILEGSGEKRFIYQTNYENYIYKKKKN